MNETEWLACDDPGLMLERLECSGKASERKLRLFACACVGQVSHLLTDERSVRAISAGELLADGRASFDDVAVLHDAAAAAAREAFTGHGMFSTAEHLAVAASYTLAR